MTKGKIIGSVVVVCAAIFAGYAFSTALRDTHDQTKINLEVAENNRLLFKFSCALPLAVAQRLDELVLGALKEAQNTERIRSLRRYHRDYQRGKDICPPISKVENKQIMKLLTSLGGKLPDDRPGRVGGNPR